MWTRAFWMFVLLGVFLSMRPLDAQAQSSQNEAEKLPEGKGKNIVATTCSRSCHGSDVFTSAKRELDEWRDLVYDMVSEGAPLQDGEVEIVAQYLAKNFGPSSASDDSKGTSSKLKSNVNQSSAKELETDLGLSEEEASAIVSYREKHGNFSNFEELSKVPGLDAKKLEEIKDCLAF